ncbi:fumarylacetoacetate hydrolase family protein [Brevibacillus sp. FSL K6-0770]|jgi:2-keto-4-pentenoate hydratase/2-oxohepta-3-ene-1,7-dioic acid hydratase (catechol pathway)|uniref:Fumarylacetoacetase n=1 Tax=Brevibacillus parabrevis TaxID=54914 RepID=A0A4Y3PQX3_BREPA|nr:MULTISPECIES: fumarylacetoacetate hydrolase family protein [Brevibacillus]MDH6352248.1 fumarylacetoacetate (FAA) hydrolase [Brevibacillus sp. 1238]MED2254550.1 fumarylacetoacetate hydrolase family protein [Brevibacillus parabrevis]NRQ56167.1 fumarylacetoacetate hydrolase family protein [Brevibacillus sp. HD1.4A]RNB94655.1 fumarylacetoacetate hydrolase family protein [Brevibacillus parabrevis]GEB34366.1 fumarylacetoacetase [Brevibacillus parabrevis]
MKLVSYRQIDRGAWRAGLLAEGKITDIAQALPGAPDTLLGLLEQWEEWKGRLLTLAQSADVQATGLATEDVFLGSPLPRPASFRDFYAFEAHVKTARARRGLDMIPEWYRFPVFYFSNAAAFLGPDASIQQPKATEWLDYELEVACVIGKAGADIPPERAHEHIAGFCILNDWSARDIQREEVKVGLGPAKGKDFATSMGPWLVTPEELEDVRVAGAKGERYDLTMVARVNGVEYSRGNLLDIHYTFAEMIARASQDCMLYPGDVIGSGTVGTGCILELGPEQYGWLKPGDVVELEVERLGVLRNTISESR